MKKFVCLCLFMLLLVGLCACGGEAAEEKKERLSFGDMAAISEVLKNADVKNPELNVWDTALKPPVEMENNGEKYTIVDVVDLNDPEKAVGKIVYGAGKDSVMMDTVSYYDLGVEKYAKAILEACGVEPSNVDRVLEEVITPEAMGSSYWLGVNGVFTMFIWGFEDGAKDPTSKIIIKDASGITDYVEGELHKSSN